MPTETCASVEKAERVQLAGILPRIFCAIACLLPVFQSLPALAQSENDLFSPIAPGICPPYQAPLLSENAKRAEAMAHFASALFLEESLGPEKALPEYLESLKQDPGNVRLALDVAREYLRRGDPKSALGIVQAAAKTRPNDFLPEHLLAEIYLYHLQEPLQAIRHARRAASLAPEVFAPVELLWSALVFMGQSTKAAALLASIANKSTVKDARFWLDFAALHRRLPLDNSSVGTLNRERMKFALEKVRELGKNDAQTLAIGGDLSAISGWPAIAAEFYSDAYALDPELPALPEKLAATLLKIGDSARAVPVLEKMLENNPQNLAVCDQLGTIAFEQGNLDVALRYRQRALPLAPPSAARRLEIIQILLRLGRLEQAAADLESARAEYPGVPIFSYLLAVTRLDQKKSAESLSLFRAAEAEAIASNSTDLLTPHFYFQSAIAAEQSGDTLEAEARLRRCIELDPANAARAENYLGYMWVVRGENLDEAGRLIESALAKEPTNGAFMDSLGWLYYQKGKYADALVKLLRASELLDEPDPVVFEHIGDTYKKLGRVPEAILFWQKSLQLLPENAALAAKIDAATSRVATKTTLSANTP